MCLGGSTMLGSNDQDTDMDMIIILPKIIFGTEDPIFSGDEKVNSLYNYLKLKPLGAYKIGGRIPLIRLYYGKIQSNVQGRKHIFYIRENPFLIRHLWGIQNS